MVEPFGCLKIQKLYCYTVINSNFKEWKEMRNLDVLKYALSQDVPGQTVRYKERE
jgi:hypothetical protein